MYEKDKKVRITVRVNQEQFEFISEMAQMIGVSPSEYIRQVVNAGMYTSNKLKEEIKRRENEKTNINDIVQ